MNDSNSFRRNGKRIWRWRQSIAFKVPLEVKNKFTEKARANGMSQAEFGLALILLCMEKPEILRRAVNHYLMTDFASDPPREPQEREQYDPTFGGVFKSSFPKEQHDE